MEKYTRRLQPSLPYTMFCSECLIAWLCRIVILRRLPMPSFIASLRKQLRCLATRIVRYNTNVSLHLSSETCSAAESSGSVMECRGGEKLNATIHNDVEIHQMRNWFPALWD